MRRLLRSRAGVTDLRMTATDRPFRFRYTHTGDEDVALWSCAVGAAVAGTITVEDSIVVSWLVEGIADLDVGRVTIPLRIGTPVLLPPGRVRFRGRDVRTSTIRFSRAFVERVAAEHGATGAASLRFRAGTLPDPDAVPRWHRAVRYVVPELLDAQHPIPTAAHAERNRRLAIALLDVFPHGTDDPPMQAAQARIRAALAFIETEARQPITTADIATAAQLSPRGLQLAFRRDFATTPRNYLEHVRLVGVHRALEHADPARTTVAVLAREWGFTHLGRFSASYRQRFGELPSVTLRRSA